MKKYGLIYRAGNVEPQPDEMKVWKEWFNKLKSDGTLIDIGVPFQHEGKVVQVDGKIKNEPIEISTGEVVIAYNIIQAKDIDEAIQIVQDGPATKYHCSVEIRETISM